MNTHLIKNNNVPRPLVSAINLARIAYAGAQSFGATTGLEQNSAPKIGADLHDVIGDPATPHIPGKQALYTAQIVAVKEAYEAKRSAIAAGRELCRLAINLLRPWLGNEWNNAWIAAGFHQPSLALPRQPAAMLTALRAYFAMHPARENAVAGVTASAAEAAAVAIDFALLTVATAKSTLVIMKRERDQALKRLRARLCGLRAELAQILADNDGAWYEFGFRRPADGVQPEPVTELQVSEVATGTVLVKWTASPRATNYRVTWKPASSTDPATDAGVCADTQCTIPDLPAGIPILIRVSARNVSGETAPAEATVVLQEKSAGFNLQTAIASHA